MTNDASQPKPSAVPSAADASSPRSLPPDSSAPGALLRALLAGAVALLVMLLPGQFAASRAGYDGWHGCSDGACSIGNRAALDDPSRWRRTSALEIRRRDNC